VAEATWSDLINQSKGALELIPDGEQNGKIVSAEDTQASTGALMYKLKIEITDGPFVKRRISTNLVVSADNPIALAIFFRNCENIGLDGNFFASNPNKAQVAQAMMNRPCRVNVGHKNWQGVDRNEIKGWLPLGGAGGPGLPGAGGPVAPGMVTGPAMAPLPTSASVTAPSTTTTAGPVPPQTLSPVVGNGPTVGAGPATPDGPPALPI
jgi:hypothetical protein